MVTTPRSELLEELEKALTDEAYDGGMGALTETEFTFLVRGLAETAVTVIIEAPVLTEDDAHAEAERRHPSWQQRRVLGIVHCGHWGTGFVEGALWADTTAKEGHGV